MSKKTFNAIDSHAWKRIAGWLRRKHRIGRSGLRRFCDRCWRFASNGVVFTGASTVPVTRYHYRGTRIPADHHSLTVHRQQHLESRMR